MQSLKRVLYRTVPLSYEVSPMKRLSVLSALLASLTVLLLQGCSANSNALSYEDQYGYCDNTGLQQQLSTIAPETPNSVEKLSLLRMREEEKLAHDVYTVLYQKWGNQVFSNIAQSEQTHMDAVALLLKRYNIADPASSTLGVFTDTSLQALYITLRDKGTSSLADALSVGATIEDLDLSDLKTTVEVDNADIRLVYDNLSRGSRNHMRAFVRNLQSLGLSYTPVYISLTEFNTIIAGDTERGRCGG